METVWEQDGQLGNDFPPVRNGHGSFARDGVLRQPQELLEGFFMRENGGGFGHFPQLPVQALNRVCGVDNAANWLWVGEHGAEFVPVFFPAIQVHGGGWHRTLFCACGGYIWWGCESYAPRNAAPAHREI